MRKIFDLEHDGHRWLKLNDSTGVQAKLFVVVEDGVHVFNPLSVDWSIKNNPFEVRSLGVCCRCYFDGKNTIIPLAGVHIRCTIELGL